ncbi:acetyl-CoA carboxylase biotin carboxyl carrier protein subunit [Thermococcus siculi]|uniref:Acetyl-CoA carboxylase biotin carboxyl carrier protein subunit n=1 Tax=Thermococcus siculi TaxID=72803 RepID=A0A2Z2MXB4_9EURY|nr:acetyl-CoA carboxylase biotin carboxyl carrier protein subunit [Thermococcus siculi]ASJ08550.1 acetyl-CoA carboxylase biotin carboxyl carrier protein subunit [Thermococcus siculi]
MAKVKVIVDGVEYEVEVEELPGGRFKVSFEDKTYEVEAKGLGIDVSALSAPASVPTTSVPAAPSPAPVSAAPAAPAAPAVPATPTPAPAGEGVVTAPMPGKILRILVKEGEQVKTGLLILEAMKMENEIPAPKDGVVKKILVKEGDTVDTGQALIELG